jgi:hypothetical protein
MQLTGTEIVSLDDGDPQTTTCSVESDTSTSSSTSNDQQVEFAFRFVWRFSGFTFSNSRLSRLVRQFLVVMSLVRIDSTLSILSL